MASAPEMFRGALLLSIVAPDRTSANHADFGYSVCSREGWGARFPTLPELGFAPVARWRGVTARARDQERRVRRYVFGDRLYSGTGVASSSDSVSGSSGSE